jgi:hypothetical protein
MHELFSRVEMKSTEVAGRATGAQESPFGKLTGNQFRFGTGEERKKRHGRENLMSQRPDEDLKSRVIGGAGVA